MARKIKGPEIRAANAEKRKQEKYEKIIAAIPGSRGTMYGITKKTGMHYETVMEFFRDHPEAKTLLDNEKSKLVDMAEDGLYQLVEQLDFKAIHFVLVTLGKSRGYVEDTKDIPVPPVININFARSAKKSQSQKKAVKNE